MDTNEEQQKTHKLSQILSPNFTFTKRQVGIALLIIGILGFIGILALDFVGGGREGGIGPTQQAALGLMVFVALVGLSLIPLGDMPA
jgi:predicted MFS family arabinose efflux permease